MRPDHIDTTPTTRWEPLEPPYGFEPDALASAIANTAAATAQSSEDVARGIAAFMNETWKVRNAAQADTDRVAALESTLREVLRHFTEKGHPGVACVRTGWIQQSGFDRWYAVAYPEVGRG